MTYVKPEYIQETDSTQPNWLNLAMIRLWIASLCFFLGITKEEFIEQVREQYKPSRRQRRNAQHYKNKPRPPARSSQALKPLLPRTLGVRLSRTQILERTTRISSLSRFQIYNFLYYRWDYWRIGAIRQRARTPKGANGPVPHFQTCGLSNAHAWPDWSVL